MERLTSIVMLTLNELEYTRRCIESIARHTPEAYELVLVDNGSTDGTVDYLRSIEGATVIANDANLGFGGGCNQGIAASRGDLVLLLNNDTVVTDGWLAALQRGLDDDHARGFVGPRSNHVAGPQVVEGVGYDVWSLDGLDDFASGLVARERGTGFAATRLIGFCLLLRREVLEAIGGFDVRFGLGNFEDDDLCLRAAVAGWRGWVCNDSYVHHFGSRTFAGARIDYQASMQRNWRRFARKWGMQPDAPVGAGYAPESIVAGTRFDAAVHYAPVVAVPDDEASVSFERRSATLLVATLPGRDGDLRDAFDAACIAYGPDDDVTVVVRIDPSDAGAGAVLDEVADRHDPHLPDVVVLEASGRNDEGIVRACDRVLCHGAGAWVLEGMARLHGRRAVTVEDLRSGRDVVRAA